MTFYGGVRNMKSFRLFVCFLIIFSSSGFIHARDLVFNIAGIPESGKASPSLKGNYDALSVNPAGLAYNENTITKATLSLYFLPLSADPQFFIEVYTEDEIDPKYKLLSEKLMEADFNINEMQYDSHTGLMYTDANSNGKYDPEEAIDFTEFGLTDSQSAFLLSDELSLDLQRMAENLERDALGYINVLPEITFLWKNFSVGLFSGVDFSTISGLLDDQLLYGIITHSRGLSAGMGFREGQSALGFTLNLYEEIVSPFMIDTFQIHNDNTPELLYQVLFEDLLSYQGLSSRKIELGVGGLVTAGSVTIGVHAEKLAGLSFGMGWDIQKTPWNYVKDSLQYLDLGLAIGSINHPDAGERACVSALHIDFFDIGNVAERSMSLGGTLELNVFRNLHFELMAGYTVQIPGTLTGIIGKLADDQPAGESLVRFKFRLWFLTFEAAVFGFEHLFLFDDEYYYEGMRGPSITISGGYEFT
jgi:hypothetical protein